MRLTVVVTAAISLLLVACSGGGSTATRLTIVPPPGAGTYLGQYEWHERDVGAFQWGDLTHAEASHSLKLFTSEVMPAVS